MLKLSFYVPESHVEVVKRACFDAGGGRIGAYDSCSWQALGQGQFRPLPSSTPFIGERDQLQQVAEYKVEMVCEQSTIRAVVRALRDAHPYEEPAYNVCRLESLEEFIEGNTQG